MFFQRDADLLAEIKQLKILPFCPLQMLKFFLPNEKLEFKF
jgi:hypothetical protein